MALNNNPVFPGKIRTLGVTLSSSAMTGTATDTPTGTVLVGTVGADGAQGARVTVMPLGSISATVFALYRRKAADGANVRRLVDTLIVGAQTVSPSAPPTPKDFVRAATFDWEALDEVYVGSWTAAGSPCSIDALLYDLTA